MQNIKIRLFLIVRVKGSSELLYSKALEGVNLQSYKECRKINCSKGANLNQCPHQCPLSHNNSVISLVVL